MENHGTRPESRFKLMRERVEAMRAIWTADQAEYHGDLVDFDPIFMWPKPIQKPHPPIHVGGGFPGAARRAVRYEAGRDPATLEVSVFAAQPERDALARHRDAGIARAVLMLPPNPRDQILPLLDDLASTMNSVA